MSTLLWATPGATADPAGYEPNDSITTATEITAGYYAGLTIDVGDEDFYNITLAVGDDLAVTICNMATMFDLYLYDTLGTQQNASTSSSGDSEKVWWFAVPVQGNYTIRVVGSGSNSGSYDLRIESPDIDDSKEENDEFNFATFVSYRSSTPDLQIYDADYFTFNLNAGEYLNATIQRASIESNGYFYINAYNSAHALITSANAPQGGSSATVLLQAGSTGEWFFVVVSASGGWGNYTLVMQDIVDDQYEDNDLVGDAKVLDIDSLADMYALAFNPILKDVDNYQFKLNAGEMLYSFLLGGSVNSNSTFQITNTMGLVLASAGFIPGQTYPFANYTIPTTGYYNVRVYPTANPHQLSYGLMVCRLNVSHPADITYQPGQTGSSITWRVDDSYMEMMCYLYPGTPFAAGTAKIYMDGVPLVDEYAWNNTKLVSLNVEGLAEGTYNFTIVASGWGGVSNSTVRDTVIVTVKTSGTSDPDGQIPGYPVAILAGFSLVAIFGLAVRKRRTFL